VKLGMKPIDALIAATSNAAAVVRSTDRGRLKAGMIADLLVVDGDATARIEALRDVAMVYKGGAPVDRDALAVGNKNDLVLTAVRDRKEGESCLAKEECASGAACDSFRATCTKLCDGRTFTGCPAGSACFPDETGTAFCVRGDGCDLLAQACPNQTACIYGGNGSTFCWFAGTAKAGEQCGLGGECAIGLQCSFASGTCEELCDPQKKPCTGGKTCTDVSAEAGLPAGVCR
jgi:hypothetical protein